MLVNDPPVPDPADPARLDPKVFGGREDLQIYYAVGARAAGGAKWPEWKPGSEFKARRDKMLGR